MHLRTLLTASSALSSTSIEAESFYTATSSILLPYLDSLPENRTREYSQDIFAKLSTYWENHFNEDMKKLNVLPPTVTTRVSEFIPQNVDFVQKLVEKGLAYPTADGSVYFDITEYEKRGHHYAKLEPWNRGNASLLADGEGALAGNTEAATTETNEAGVLKAKKSPNDFALWKASKQGEPKWPSPWGQGRPGWHIECSVMCSEVLGGKVDIHTGGIDLAFPHHDNEIAQSEAYWDDGCCGPNEERHQWINYFLHMGHLSIQGSKMSKSLKNFVSIREALAEGGGWTPRSLRIVFLLGGWKEGVEIGKALITEAKSLEGKLNKFFTNVRAMLAEADEKNARNEFVPQPFGKTERELFEALDKTRSEVHAHLCNSFNTSDTLASISNLITTANLYIALPPTHPKSLAPLAEIARWITWLVQIFGLDPNGTKDAIGWAAESVDGGASEGKEKTLMPYLRALSEFRDEVRSTSMAAMKAPSEDPKALPKTLLGFTDKLRNQTLPPLGVSLDDRDGQAALVKLVDPAVLLAELREKEEKAAKKAEEKAKRIEAERKAQEEKDKKDSVDPATMFKTEEYEEWDAEGLPTKLKGGEELPKSRAKKVEKLFKAQKKAYEGWLKRQGDAKQQ
jgi:cysteinyl-tRNA synthetase